MDSVDIFLFYAVGFSVILFLILGSIEESSKKEKQLISQHCKSPSFQEEREREEERETPVSDCDDDKGGEEEEERLEDDWEGVERTELEKSFGEAVVFVSYADCINGDLKMELYGLQKVALEGPCHGSQPMLFNLSARAKWNAWQKLGKMSREMAMEKYLDILGKEDIPGWKGGVTGDGKMQQVKGD